MSKDRTENTEKDDLWELCDAISQLMHSDTGSETFSVTSDTPNSSELGTSSLLDVSSTESVTNYYIVDWRSRSGPGSVGIIHMFYFYVICTVFQAKSPSLDITNGNSIMGKYGKYL